MQVLAVLPGFALWLGGKEPACNAGDTGSTPGLGRFPQEGSGNPLHYSCLENPTNRRAWWATVHGVTKSWTLKRPNNSSHSEAYVQTSRSVILSRGWLENPGDIWHCQKAFSIVTPPRERFGVLLSQWLEASVVLNFQSTRQFSVARNCLIPKCL